MSCRLVRGFAMVVHLLVSAAGSYSVIVLSSVWPGALSRLFILSAQRNLITQLPGCMTRLRLDTLDLFGNPIQQLKDSIMLSSNLGVPSLREQSARLIRNEGSVSCFYSPFSPQRIAHQSLRLDNTITLIPLYGEFPWDVVWNRGSFVLWCTTLSNLIIRLSFETTITEMVWNRDCSVLWCSTLSSLIIYSSFETTVT